MISTESESFDDYSIFIPPNFCTMALPYEGSREHPARVEETDRVHGGGIFCVRKRKVNFTSIYPYIKTEKQQNLYTVTSIMTEKKRNSEDGKEATKKPKPEKSRRRTSWLTASGTRWSDMKTAEGNNRSLKLSSWIVDGEHWALLTNQRPKLGTIIQSETLISGLRACCNKGGAEFLKHKSPDILLVLTGKKFRKLTRINSDRNRYFRRRRWARRSCLRRWRILMTIPTPAGSRQRRTDTLESVNSLISMMIKIWLILTV